MEEKQYLELVKNIINNGIRKTNRTNILTYSLFSQQLRFKLDKLPLLTTKKMNYNSILEELLFFIRGDTDSKILESKNVNIWKANSINTNGELGPIYGFQWRHYGSNIQEKKGYDQLSEVIRLLKEDKYSRRIIMTAWNPLDIDKMVLPPCHCFVQFLVHDENKLTCILYQRSADMGLGIPFNITSYSILTYIIAHLTDLIPYEFIINMGDCHVYENHISQLYIQMYKTPYDFPTLEISKELKNIDDIKIEYFNLIDYKHHSYLKMDMAV